METLTEQRIQAPLYRIPDSTFSSGLPKLIGDGRVRKKEVAALLEYANKIAEINRGLDRAGAAHAAHPGGSDLLNSEFSRNQAKANEVLEPPDDGKEPLINEAVRALSCGTALLSLVESSGCDMERLVSIPLTSGSAIQLGLLQLRRAIPKPPPLTVEPPASRLQLRCLVLKASSAVGVRCLGAGMLFSSAIGFASSAIRIRSVTPSNSRAAHSCIQRSSAEKLKCA
jgi:hypothetical protein